MALPANVHYLTQDNYCGNCAFTRVQQSCPECGAPATKAGSGGAVRYWCEDHVHLDRVRFGDHGEAGVKIVAAWLCVLVCLFFTFLVWAFFFPWTMGGLACVMVMVWCSLSYCAR